ncbi:MAG: ACS family MFS transporter [Gammaproteobacteria bacterium]|nr:ACS family MFS transporter [Gammaproteobacteria bacterium]
MAADPSRWPVRYTVVGLCFLASFICYIDRVNISVAAIAMKEAFGWTETTKGLVLSSFFIGYLSLQVISGWLANRFGGRRVLGFAVLWWSVLTLLTPAAAFVSLPMLVAARIALGMGEAATYPATYNLFGRWVPAVERSRAVTIIVSGIPLGTLFALTTTGWIVARYGWPAVFHAFGVLGFLWALLWYRNVTDEPAAHRRISAAELALLPPPQSASTRRGEPIPWRMLLSKPAVGALVFNHFCSNWALYVLLAWLPSYFRSAHGVSIASAGLYAAAPWLTMFLVSNFAGWLADAMLRRGVSTTRVRKLMQTIGLMGPALFLILARDADSANVAMALMCGALGTLAFTWAGYGPNHLDIAPRYADVLMGITNTFGTIPGVIGVAVTGWLVDVTGTYSTAFVLSAAVSVAGTVVWLAFATGERIID